jgi:hypothetical protein
MPFVLIFFLLLFTHRACALDWQTNGPHRSAALPVAPGGQPGFTLMPASTTGVQFTNILPIARHLTNQVLLSGSGLAAGDVDGDGWCDLYFCALDRPNALYRNLGNWTFRDVTAESGTACAGLTSSGAAFVDLDGDGDLDLLVNTVGHGTHVFFNDGKGHFTDVGTLNGAHAGTSLAAGDLDGDGYLDVYIANYRPVALMDMPNTRFNFATVDGRKVVARVNGRPVTDPEFANRYRVSAKGGIEEDGEPDVLYHNDRGTGFTEVPFTSGAFLDEDGQPLQAPPFDWGLSVLIRDLNQDGLPDIFVCNDFDSPDRVWLNQGGGRFRAAPRLAFRKSSHFSMGVDVADINRDGFDDIFVVDMLSRDQVMRMDMQGDRNPPTVQVGLFNNRPDYMMNTLFLNRGDGTYAEIAQLAGVSASEWSWTPLFVDVDLDGYEDLLISNGHERAARSLDISDRLRVLRTERNLSAQEIFENRRLFPRQNARKVAFHNRRDLTFEDVSQAWGFNFDGVSHGMILADLDNDGDQDVVVNNLNGPAALLRNNGSAPRLAVRLRGTPPNTRGIGARIRVLGGAVPEQSQEMICGGRYLSSDDPMRVFAAGTSGRPLTIEVTWRNGQQTTLTDAQPDRVYEISEAGATDPKTPKAPPLPANREPWFADVSAALGHAHHDDPFDDFAVQPSLPIRLSQLGPGVAWADLDGDGWEDLVIATGKGGRMAGYGNARGGKFVRLTGAAFEQTAARDQTTVLHYHRAGGSNFLIAGSSNYEDGQTNGAAVLAFAFPGGTSREWFPAGRSSVGPMALADLEGRGRCSLFVGGRVTRARYPEPASSTLLRQSGDGFIVDPENTARLADLGLVSGAVFTDLDGDGDPDLVIACEWAPIKIFRNDAGKLTPWDWPLEGMDGAGRLSELVGSWIGVAAGDFDEDGRLDLVVTGWGMNTRYQGHLQRPLELLFGDFNGDGTVELAEAFYDPAMRKLVPDRQLDFLAKGMPFLRERFTSHRAFGTLGIEEILGDKLKGARRIQVQDLRSFLFLNQGGKWRVRPLPMEAQMAPAFGVCVADLDGDGHEDLLLAQNFFASQPDTPRQDAGRGLWLRGDGRGNFQAVPGQESGLQVYGEQRGAAVADFDHDGRVDVAITQNGAETKLYQNRRAKPGLRIRLHGPPGNPDGIGAVIRLLRDGQAGPAREVHAGSGYWSQDAAVQVMSSIPAPTAVSVRWPGGQSTTNQIPASATEIVVGNEQ